MPLTINSATWLIATFALSVIACTLLKTVYLTYVRAGLRPAMTVPMHAVLRLFM